MKLNNFFKLVIAIVISELAGVIGSAFTFSAIPSWYAELVKPALNPPSWVFGPVWTALYALTGVAAFLAWSFDGAQDKKKKIKSALGVYRLDNGCVLQNLKTGGISSCVNAQKLPLKQGAKVVVTATGRQRNG